MTVCLITGEQKQRSVSEVEELKHREESNQKLRTPK